MSMRVKDQKGQATIMVTLASMAMLGLVGLAVDTGWAFFIRRAAQSATDAAALSAVEESWARYSGTFTNGVTCGTKAECQTTPVSCTSSALTGGTASNLWSACLYASQNGFSPSNPRQSVTVQSNVSASLGGVNPPTAPGVNNIQYWVTVTATQIQPQLFSAILGNKNATITASATASLTLSLLPGNMVATNQAGDCLQASSQPSGWNCGLDYYRGDGNSTINGSLFLSSSCNGSATSPTTPNCSNLQNGSSLNPNYAAWIISDSSAGDDWLKAGGIQVAGTGQVAWFQSPGTYTTGNGGWVNQSHGATQGGSGVTFQDPMTGVSQPPVVAPSPVPTCGIPNGAITQSGSSLTLGPYQYYAYTTSGSTIVPTGAPITVTGSNVTFSSSSTNCPGLLGTDGVAQSSSFPSFFFYGGLNIADVSSGTSGPGGPGGPGGRGGPGGGTTATGSTVYFDHAQYLMVGATENGTSAGSVFSTTTSTKITGDTASGTMMIFAGPNYPGLSTQEAILPSGVTTNLQYGNVDFGQQTGTDTNPTGSIKLTGVNTTSGVAPTSLSSYNQVVFWQDRGNSTVEYDAYGNVTSSVCMGTDVPPACGNPDLPPTGAEGILSATDLTLTGVVYQPRGAYWGNPTMGSNAIYSTLNDNGRCGTVSGTVQIITGAFIEDCSTVNITTGSTSVSKYQVSLIK